MDRRQLKTRKAIFDALSKLLGKKRFETKDELLKSIKLPILG